MSNSIPKITIKEVAKAANVSISTVSRVLDENNNYPVKEELVKKVREAAANLNYTPNLIGKQLKSTRSNDIGIIVPSLTNPFYPILLHGVESVLKRRGYSLLLFSSGRDSEAEVNYLKILQQKRVAGIVISSISNNRDILEELLSQKVKVVTFDQIVNDLDCSRVYINSYKTGQIAAEYLINLNHRQIAFISSPLDRYSRRAVLNGFRETMVFNKIKIAAEYIWIAKSEEEKADEIFEFENGRLATRELLRLGTPPTAIFCNNDMTAYGCLQELNENQIKVPEDVSVMGANNLVISSVTNPSLTTINLPTFQMGKTAADLLIDQIEHIEKNNIVMELTPNLVIRSSTRECKN